MNYHLMNIQNNTIMCTIKKLYQLISVAWSHSSPSITECLKSTLKPVDDGTEVVLNITE